MLFGMRVQWWRRYERLISKIILVLIVVFFCSCNSGNQKLAEFDSLKMVNDSINLILESEKNQIWLLQNSLSIMNEGYYSEAIEDFNNILSLYPKSIFNELIYDNINYCEIKLKSKDSAEKIKSKLQTLAEKKTGIKIISIETDMLEKTPILMLDLKNISKNELSI
jgi:tetratricopeptide (TPR) repeat protein